MTVVGSIPCECCEGRGTIEEHWIVHEKGRPVDHFLRTPCPLCEGSGREQIGPPEAREDEAARRSVEGEEDAPEDKGRPGRNSA